MNQPQQAEKNTPYRHNQGFGHLLVAVYAIFAVSATARALFQIVTDFSRAPLAYILSAVAAIVYIVATLALATPGLKARAITRACMIFELVGVVIVGTITVVDPELFPAATVWSRYGQGYGFVPLVLPVIGLAWLYYQGLVQKTRETTTDATTLQ